MDRHLALYSLSLPSLKFLALDSTSVTDHAIEAFKKKRPEVTVYRSQRYAIRKLREIAEPWDPRVDVQLDESHPEMRKLYGAALFETVAHIDISFVADEQPGVYPETFSHELRWLQYCPTIESARLTWCRLDDAGAQYLLRLPRLKELWVIGNELSFRGVRDIASIPSLRRLYFSIRPGEFAAPALVDLDIEELKTLNPQLEIEQMQGF